LGESESRDAGVIFTSRDIPKGIQVQEKIRFVTSNKSVFCKFLDFLDFETIHNFVAEVNQAYPRIDFLINNVGVFFHPPQLTKDGFDVTFQSNYLSKLIIFLIYFELFPYF